MTREQLAQLEGEAARHGETVAHLLREQLEAETSERKMHELIARALRLAFIAGSEAARGIR